MKLLDLGVHELLKVNVKFKKSPKIQHIPAIIIKL